MVGVEELAFPCKVTLWCDQNIGIKKKLRKSAPVIIVADITKKGFWTSQEQPQQTEEAVLEWVYAIC